MGLYAWELTVVLVFALIFIAIILLTEQVYNLLHKFIKLFTYSVPAPRSKQLILHCTYCSKELTEPEMYSFRGWVGCEQCIRDYYRDRPAQELEFQLQTRQSSARAWLTANRKVLLKAMTRNNAA